MMKSESDLMRGIDDKFQELMSQFEMNMDILKMKKPTGHSQDDAVNLKTNEESTKEDNSHKQRSINLKERSLENGSDKKQINTKRSETPVKIKEKTQPKIKDEPDENTLNDNLVSNVLKFISDSADAKNKKKKNKTISFSGQNNAVNYHGSDDNKSVSVATGSKKGYKKKKRLHADTESADSSKKLSLNGNSNLKKKPSKTVTNVSKKGKRRNVKIMNFGRDWITFNRNNAGKAQKPAINKSKSNKPQIKERNKSASEKVKDKQNKIAVTDIFPENKEAVNETIENKLISDFIQNEMLNKIRHKDKDSANSRTGKNNEREKLSIRTITPKNVIVNDKNESNKQKNHLTLKNNTETNKMKPDVNKKSVYFKKDKHLTGGKLGGTKSLLDNTDYKKKYEFTDSMDYEINKENNGLIKGSQFSLGRSNRSLKDLKSVFDIANTRSDIHVTNYGECGEGQLEMDEYFREIPFVVGRSVSRTFNLGLSFQYAMSMLKRIHSKKDVKDVLSIGCPDNKMKLESIHCLGTGTCEAMLSSNWTKKDEEEWEENPWDPELNRRRPKCSCLPNNSTTLKNVLKQLSLRRPNYSTRSLSSFSCTAQKLESEIDMITRPNLKKAKSETRTELLRNIRNIQMQLSPPSEILK